MLNDSYAKNKENVFDFSSFLTVATDIKQLLKRQKIKSKRMIFVLRDKDKLAICRFT